MAPPKQPAPLDLSAGDVGNSTDLSAGDVDATPAPTASVGPWQPTARERFLNPDLYPVGQPGESVGKNLKNLAQRGGQGIFQLADAAVHPGRTVRSLAGSVLPDSVIRLLNKSSDAKGREIPEGEPNPLASAYQGVNSSRNPWELAGKVAPIVGQTIATAGLGEAAPEIASDVKGLAPRVAEAVTKTGPRETRNLVKDTQAQNATAVQKAAEDNAAQEMKRAGDLKKHFEKTQAAEKANVAATAPVARKTALDRGVEHLEPEIAEQLKSTEKSVNAKANEKYQALQKSLGSETAAPYQALDEEGHVTGEPETITQHLFDVAEAPLRGTETESTIVKSIGKRVENGELDLTYNDLQGYREEIGRKLRTGTLPPGEYASYKALMPEIDKAIQEIADRKGLGKAQAEARAYYRQYAETFLDPDSAVRSAIDTSDSLKRKPGDVVAKLRGKSPAIEALARYNPELARRLNTITGYQAEAKALPSKPGKITPAPKLAPKPAPIAPEVKTIGPNEIREAKAKGLAQRTSRIRARGEWIATGAAGYGVLSNLLHGNLAQIPADLFYGGAAVGGVEGISRILENPKVVDLLTRPTARDIAEVPPNLRGDLGQIAQIAAKKGIRVDPRLYIAAPALAPRKNATDEWANQ